MIAVSPAEWIESLEYYCASTVSGLAVAKVRSQFCGFRDLREFAWLDYGRRKVRYPLAELQGHPRTTGLLSHSSNKYPRSKGSLRESVYLRITPTQLCQRCGSPRLAGFTASPFHYHDNYWLVIGFHFRKSSEFTARARFGYLNLEIAAGN